VLAQQCPSIAPNWEDPQGVPISGLIFGSRRSAVIPLVFEAFDWLHGVFLGSAMSTETTAAITGQVGVVRRDPMAMIPFCGYNMADYFAHWLAVGPRLAKPPRVFRVNWFRRDGDGKFLWPGYGENMRVLKWMVERIRGTGRAEETPVGWVPAPGALDTGGLDVAAARLRQALDCNAAEWLAALDDLHEFYTQFGGRLPAPIAETLARTRRRFQERVVDVAPRTRRVEGILVGRIERRPAAEALGKVRVGEEQAWPPLAVGHEDDPGVRFDAGGAATATADHGR